MPGIWQMPPHLADLIAAGEVVERPASVVKELVENAVDAGATAITVELQNGGMTSIRVTDNGCGISPAELPTAFLRHATSKLRSPEGLSAIGTLGFRGEALAAIAAVSRVDIFSCEADAAMGASLSLEGGVPGQVTAAGCPKGTTVVVRDLFYNTPARLKFMKSDSAESAAAASLLQSLALSHPEVSVRYLRDGREELHTPGDNKLLSAVYAVRGREFALGLTPVSGCGDNITVQGFVTEPRWGRGTRAMQTFFCCGRLIKSPLLTAALEEAYANRLLKGKFPGCVLHIDLPLHLVDVNVHPSKTQVKFANEKAVYGAVFHVVRDTLDRAARPQTPEKPAQSAFRTMDAAAYRQEQKTQAAFRPAVTSSEMRGRVVVRDSGAGRIFPPKAAEAESRPVSSAPVTAFPKPLEPSAVRPAAKPAEESAPKPFEKPVERADPAAPSPEQVALFPEEPRPWRYVGEVLRTYIVAEDGDTVYLIDKHAAHERMNFDRLKAGAEPLSQQELLQPQTVELDTGQYAALLEQTALLEEFGFLVEDFGAGCLLVRAIPMELAPEQTAETLELLGEKLLQCGTADPRAARDAALHTVACKAAIKGGWVTDAAELQILIQKVQSGEVSACPHGRPVVTKLTRYQLEKMFLRA